MRDGVTLRCSLGVEGDPTLPISRTDLGDTGDVELSDRKNRHGERSHTRGTGPTTEGDTPWVEGAKPDGGPTRTQTVQAMNAAKRRPSSPTGVPAPYEPVAEATGGLEARLWIEGAWLPVGVIVLGPSGMRVRLGGPPPELKQLAVALRTSRRSRKIFQLREEVVDTRRDASGTILNLRHRELHSAGGVQELFRFVTDVLGFARPRLQAFRDDDNGSWFDFARAASVGGAAPTDDFTISGDPKTAVQVNPVARFQRQS